MATYNISKVFNWNGRFTERVSGVCRMFGLSAERLRNRQHRHSCRLQINPGDIVYITGASGSGKSILLGELEKAVPPKEKISLDDIKLPLDKSVIDCFDLSLLESLKLLSIAGLSDCFCILNQPVNLSPGQQYRFRLATAMASGRKFVFADEFCSELDRLTAASLCYKLRQFANRTGTTFILASSHEDTMAELAPDVIVIKNFVVEPYIIYKNSRRQSYA
ncbi:ABC transporter [Planctomycetota bacterium]